MNCQKYIPRKLFTRDYKNYDENAFRRELSLTDWNLLFSNYDFNLSWNAFKDELQQLVNVHARLTEKMITGKPTPWLTIDIKVAINDREHYLKVARRTNNKADWQLYRESCNYVTYAIRKSKFNYCKNLLTETSHKPKDFWKNIKSFFPTKQKSDLPPMMIIDGKKTFDKQTIPNFFCMFFTTIGSKLQNQVISVQSRTWKSYENKNMKNYMKVNSTFFFQPTNRSSVAKLLKALKTSKAAGPDNIPARMMKDAYKELAYPLCHLIKESINILPTAENAAKVTPIYKSEAHSLFDNYLPVSVLNMLSKIFEKVIAQQIATYLENNELLYKHQHGFRKNNCTQDAVIYLHDHIRQEVIRKNVTGALYIDLRKAFDTVSQSCFLSKLSYYGICGTELNWIFHYLFNRTQYVAYNNQLP